MALKASASAAIEPEVKSNEVTVVKPQETNIVVHATEDDLAQYAGAGLEEVSGSDITVARLVILQALSPACQMGHAKYVKGASPGQIINTLTRDIYDVNDADPLIVVPAYFNVKYFIWRPRGAAGGGGGIIRICDRAEGEALEKTTSRDDKNKNVLPDGNLLVQTNQHFVVAYEPTTGNIFKAIMGMSSTALKYSRQWLGVIDAQKMVIKGKSIKLPSFAKMYQIKTGLEPKGENIWCCWNIALMDGSNSVIPKILFDEAVEFHKLMKSGHVVIGVEEDQMDMPHERPIARPGAPMPPGMSDDLDDSIPF